MYKLCMEIEFDSSKATSNLRKHGVSFAHAESALRDTNALTVEDPDAKDEQRFVTLGMDALGRIPVPAVGSGVLVVVHTPRGERLRIISARKASPKECHNYA